MNINESKFRQIIREEALRALREQDGGAAAAPVASATPSPEWDVVNGTLGVLIEYLGKGSAYESAQKITMDAQRGWMRCKDKSSPQLKAAVDAMAAGDAGNPTSKLAAALVSLSGGTPMALGGGAIANLSTGLGPTDQKGLADVLARAAPKIVDNIVKHSSPEVVTTSPAAVTAGLDLTYTVKSGDSISKILRDYYGIATSQSSMPIYKAFAAEKLGSDDPSKIKLGANIKLPSSLSLLGKNYPRKR
jgi:hypothetical protein